MRQNIRPVRFEIGLTTDTPTTCSDLTKILNRQLPGANKIAAISSYGKAAIHDAGSTINNETGRSAMKLCPSPGTASSGGNNSYRLVSGWNQSDQDMEDCARIFKHVEKASSKNAVAALNKVVGLRVHVIARGMDFPALVRLCQNFCKYESAMDVLLPQSRRTGSHASNKFFQSISETLGGQAAESTLKHKLEMIGACRNTESLVELVNPRGSSYKLNLRPVIALSTNNATASSSPPYIEFRQHSSTSNPQKMQAWVTVCNALLERAISHGKAPLAFHASRTVDEQVDTFFSVVVKDPQCKTYFEERRAALQREGQDNAAASSTTSRASSDATGKPTKKPKTTEMAKAHAKASREGQRRNNDNSSSKLCGCCFQELPKTLANAKQTCACQDNGHVFCASCIQSYAKEEIYGNHNGKLLCMALGGDCKSELNSRQLEAILPKKHKLKLKELQFVRMSADTQGLVMCECPKCGSSGMIPKTEKTFSCPLGSCRFHSCRRCAEEAHPGLKCSQVEKQNVRDGRTQVEEAMSGERIRQCPSCHTRIILGEGCTWITCTQCRRGFCYACRDPRCTSHYCNGRVPEMQAVRNAGAAALSRVADDNVGRELDGLVDRLT
ncbi:ring finger protein 216 [Seminavis robusta]|uniref:Ring finger protein 216 n=1 Tax=Seminavis robusta TaxID=568900 RepID=A0A9N8DIS6_9STRA|nr:ring finger protein 216 [Seminavis robusta]|eukprot:Sro165_g073720.1 ring finger protein 216 (612) ;mRNA; f:4089-6068